MRDLPAKPAIVLVAVKPQMMAEALPALRAMGNGETLFVSVAAGTTIAYFEQTLGAQTPVVRAMPNTPAAISQGITAIIGNDRAGSKGLDEAEVLLSAVGEVVRLERRGADRRRHGRQRLGARICLSHDRNAGSSGRGAGSAGADGAATGHVQPSRVRVRWPWPRTRIRRQLRVNVTSPNGTTQAALEVLMDEKDGFPALMRRAVAAAANRSRELARG